MKRILIGMMLISSLSFVSCKSKTEAIQTPPEYKTMQLDTTTAVVYADIPQCSKVRQWWRYAPK